MLFYVAAGCWIPTAAVVVVSVTTTTKGSTVVLAVIKSQGTAGEVQYGKIPVEPIGYCNGRHAARCCTDLSDLPETALCVRAYVRKTRNK